MGREARNSVTSGSYSNGVHRTVDPKLHAIRKELLGTVLVKATVDGCEQLGTTGLGFVLSSMSYWTVESMEVGLGKSLSTYLRALADIADPKKSHTQKQAAEMRRRKAFDTMSEFANTSPNFGQEIDRNDPQP